MADMATPNGLEQGIMSMMRVFGLMPEEIQNAASTTNLPVWVYTPGFSVQFRKGDLGSVMIIMVERMNLDRHFIIHNFIRDDLDIIGVEHDDRIKHFRITDEQFAQYATPARERALELCVADYIKTICEKYKTYLTPVVEL
jgi:hypothetical protein